MQIAEYLTVLQRGEIDLLPILISGDVDGNLVGVGHFDRLQFGTQLGNQAKSEIVQCSFGKAAFDGFVELTEFVCLVEVHLHAVKVDLGADSNGGHLVLQTGKSLVFQIEHQFGRFN